MSDKPKVRKGKSRRPTAKDLQTILSDCKWPWRNENKIALPTTEEWAYDMDKSLRRISRRVSKILGVESPLQ